MCGIKELPSAAVLSPRETCGTEADSKQLLLMPHEERGPLSTQRPKHTSCMRLNEQKGELQSASDSIC